MDADARAFQIYETILWGRENERNDAQASLDDPELPVNRNLLRILLLDTLTKDFSPKQGIIEDREVGETRGWLVGTLARVSADDPKIGDVIRNHLDLKSEPNMWVRYWGLVGLIAIGAADLSTLASKIQKEREEEPEMIMLATAILASQGKESSIEEVKTGITDWQTLRALRFVYVPEVVENLIEIVNIGANDWTTYAAIIPLRNIPKTPGHAHRAQRAALTLENFINTHKDKMWDYMRIKALAVLGDLGVEQTAPALVSELIEDNPGIVREAALALERLIGTQPAVSRVVEAASKAGPDRIEVFATALRWMNNRNSIVETLEDIMESGHLEHQEAARVLLSEIGGLAAFQKLRARTESTEKFTQVLEKTEEKVRNLFEASIQEARQGFKVSIAMDMIVFFLGIALISLSAGVILVKGGTLDNWVGLGLTGGMGVLGVLYGTLVAKPRQQVQTAVDHLMNLQVIFLAYLRQLHQNDQAYTRRMLEDQAFTSDELKNFSWMIEQTMENAIKQLTLLGMASKPTTVVSEAEGLVPTPSKTTKTA